MMMHDATKLIFENALKKLLNTTSFHKITIQSLVDSCNSTRQTFYYHFKDKYDLVSWIYQRQTAEIIEKFPMISWFEVMIGLFKAMEQDYLFYSKVLIDDSQNSLLNHMVTYDIQVYTSMLHTVGGINKIDEQLAFDIEFHAFACVHMTQLWIKKNIRETPEEIAHKLINAMPSHLYESLPNRGI